MAMAILTWDLPPQEQMAVYNEKARTDWIPTAVRQPGVKEFRALRNAFHASPHAMSITEYDSLAAALKFIETEDFARVMEGLRAAGCTNITVQLWDVSPLVPEPIRPGS
ncbi:hypothetical protein NET02_15745 [Thermomicrobiaceae bacterium CFH 74404]|uniref:Uncharacterized protein n=1 Tax=Thermalbibacter longus TaxID=2951981 RepID=A0AA42BC79_9BACT|nr:hypothetical protein [Thermalbibacter longus]MCM8750599.1 hypothetical protein [Thermalbibacter longus]